MHFIGVGMDEFVASLDSMVQGRVLPWTEDTQSAAYPVWTDWGATQRAVFILNRQGVLDTMFNITPYDPENPQDYAQVKNLILEAAKTPPSLCGDVNCDGQVTPGDALCTFWRSILGAWQDECACSDSESTSDPNCDGRITPGDALCIFWRSILGQWTEECSTACECSPLPETVGRRP